MHENTAPSPDSQHKKKSLKDLLPEKAPVQTSLGTLYVRHISGSDWTHFDSEESAELGMTAVQRLVSRVQQQGDKTPLAGEDVDTLHNADFVALASEIAKINGWNDVLPSAGLNELGEAVKRGRAQELQRHQKMLNEMRNPVGTSYAFPETNLARPQEQMMGQVGNHQSMTATEYLKAAMETTGPFDQSLQNAMSGTHAGMASLQHQKMLDDIRDSIGSSYAFLEKGTLDRLQEQMTGLIGIRQPKAVAESFTTAMGSAGSLDSSLQSALSGAHAGTDALQKLDRSFASTRADAPQFVETLRLSRPGFRGGCLV